jgi:hypothetical protein
MINYFVFADATAIVGSTNVFCGIMYFFLMLAFRKPKAKESLLKREEVELESEMATLTRDEI